MVPGFSLGGRDFPLLRTSEEAVRRTLRSEESHACYSFSWCTAWLIQLIPRTAGGRTPTLLVKLKLVADSNPDSGANWAALVVEQAHGDSGNQYYRNSLAIRRDLSLEGIENRLLPDALGTSLTGVMTMMSCVPALLLANDGLIADRHSKLP
jgi:hypothetical protein